MIAKLSKRTVDASLPVLRATVIYDTDLKGFGVRLAPSGALSWFIEYRPGAGGRRVAKKRYVLGGRELTPEEARTLAKQTLASVALGNDPSATRQTHRQAPTLREFGEEYLEDEAGAKLKPRTVTNYRIYLRKHVFPVLGSSKINMMTRGDIARLHTSIGRSTPCTANRVLECLGSLFRYAATRGIISREDNPVVGIAAFREMRRERFLNARELERLGEALRLATSTGLPYEIDESKPAAKHAPKAANRYTIIDDYAAAAILLLLLTGARLREILWLKWEYVDLERGLLLLPDSKTGAKAIVLNSASVRIIVSLPKTGDFVIAGKAPDCPRADLNRPWRAIRRYAGLHDVRIHDRRHTHASIGVGSGLSLPIVGKLLGHSQPSTTQRYAHLDADPLRKASEQIARQLSKSLDRT